jgi:hypothetical protein
VLMVGVSSCDPKKFCTLLDRVLRFVVSCTTSLHCQGDGNVSSLFDPKIATAIPVISAISTIFVTSSVSCVDFLIILLLPRGPLAVGLKKLSPGFGSLNAYVSSCRQIDYHFGLLHGDLLHSLDVTDSITESIDDLDVLDVWDGVPVIAEIFHVIPEALIMLLLDGLQSLNSKWMLVCTLKVDNEHGTHLVSDVDRSLGQIDKPRSGRTEQCRG